ncbi:MAG: DJ-1/PfpI family protein [bacterium]|nr:DJ-1/PfpI family protein [bacterium]MDD5354149.1 DJ-1/PfpI family protein [bacterium]MDD5755834.1 DJ-1/PfpI family protein [bacterium]
MSKNPAKKVLIVIAHEIFRDEEYLQPKEILESAGIKVVTASISLKPATGKLGAIVYPDVLLQDSQAGDYDAIVFVGGSGSRNYFHDPAAQALAKGAIDNKKLLASICSATGILAAAGVIKGKRVTSFPAEAEMIEQHGAHYTGQEVEIDGRLVTANGPAAAVAFGQAIRKILLKE